MTTRRMSARLQLAAAEPAPASAAVAAPPPAAAAARPTRARKQPATTTSATAKASSAATKPAAAAPTKTAPSRKRTRSSVEDDEATEPHAADQPEAPATKRARSAAAAKPKAVPVAAASIGSTRASRLRAASTAATTAAKSVAAAKENAKVTTGRKPAAATATAKTKKVVVPKPKAASAAGKGKGAKVTKGKAKTKAGADADAVVEELDAESELSDLEADEAGAANQEDERQKDGQEVTDEERQRTIRFAPEPIVFDTSKDVADRPPPRRVAGKPPAVAVGLASDEPVTAKVQDEEEQQVAQEDAMDVDAPAAATLAQVESEVTTEPAAMADATVEATAQQPEEDPMQVDSGPTAAPAAAATVESTTTTAPTAAKTDAAPSTPTKPVPTALPAHLTTPSRPTPLKSAMRTPNTLSRLHLTPGRTATFSPHLTQEAETYSPADYDRSMLPNMTKDLRSTGKINRDNWIGIIRSVDKFKVKEMQVHPESKANTRVHLPGHLSPGSCGEASEDDEQEEFRLFDGSPLKQKTTVGHVNVMEAAAAAAATDSEADKQESKVDEHAENGAKAATATPAKQASGVTATPNTRRVLFPLATNNAASSSTPAAQDTPTKVVKDVAESGSSDAQATPLKSPGRLIGSVIGTVGSLISRLTPSRKSVADLVAERQQQQQPAQADE